MVEFDLPTDLFAARQGLLTSMQSPTHQPHPSPTSRGGIWAGDDGVGDGHGGGVSSVDEARALNRRLEEAIGCARRRGATGYYPKKGDTWSVVDTRSELEQTKYGMLQEWMIDNTPNLFCDWHIFICNYRMKENELSAS